VNTSVRNDLFLQNIRLARRMAALYWRLGYLRRFGTVEDAFQESCLALLRAIEKYDPAHARANFSAYLAKSVRRHLLKLHRTEGVIHVPHGAALAVRRDGNSPSVDQVQKAQAPVPFDDWQVCGGEGRPSEDAVFLREVREAVDGLPAPQRELLYRRFGLADGGERTLQEIATECGVTREAIRQREEKALGRVRQVLGLPEVPRSETARRTGRGRPRTAPAPARPDSSRYEDPGNPWPDAGPIGPEDPAPYSLLLRTLLA
jgi:RNA polymerase sigma factor (sigma-70 family)